jgi:hypothetical protein
MGRMTPTTMDPKLLSYASFFAVILCSQMRFCIILPLASQRAICGPDDGSCPAVLPLGWQSRLGG